MANSDLLSLPGAASNPALRPPLHDDDVSGDLVSPNQPGDQNRWLDAVEQHAPETHGLAARLLQALREADTGVIALTDAVRQGLGDPPAIAELHLLTLMRARLVACTCASSCPASSCWCWGRRAAFDREAS